MEKNTLHRHFLLVMKEHHPGGRRGSILWYSPEQKEDSHGAPGGSRVKGILPDRSPVDAPHIPLLLEKPLRRAGCSIDADLHGS